MAEPQFEAHENFRCIEMDKATTYVIVEGMEVDVFDSVLRGILGQKHMPQSDFVIVSGSDKHTILDFYQQSQTNNFFVILDRDFCDVDNSLPRVSTLGRYSIENYCFDNMVVRRALARVYGKSINSVEYNSEVLISYYEDEFFDLLKSIIFYQKMATNKTTSWSDSSILKKDCWRSNRDIRDELIDNLQSNSPICDKVLEIDSFLRSFPGKMIVSGIYFYIKNELGVVKLTRVYNNYKSFLAGLLSALDFSEDFCNDLDPVVGFIKSRSKVLV